MTFSRPSAVPTASRGEMSPIAGMGSSVDTLGAYVVSAWTGTSYISQCFARYPAQPLHEPGLRSLLCFRRLMGRCT
jgi:hypothetical protein